MKPVLIQTLMKSMRKRLPMPDPYTPGKPIRKDRSGTFVIITLVLLAITAFLCRGNNDRLPYFGR